MDLRGHHKTGGDGRDDGPGLSPAMEEVANALAESVPDPKIRLSLVHQLFLGDANAPYAFALQALTGKPVPPDVATEAWRLTTEVQRRWSERLGEVVSMKSAAIEAVERCAVRALPAAPDGSASTSLRHYLDRDISTGLYQKSQYEARLNDVMEHATKENPASLIFMLLEGMDQLRQRQGDQSAEEVYRTVGAHIRHHFRGTDIPCRYGANYFAVLLPDTPLTVAHTLAEELVVILQGALDGSGITVSMGVATDPGGGKSARAIESAATTVLDEARSRGQWTVGAFVAPVVVPKTPPVWRAARIAVPLLAAALAFGIRSYYSVSWNNDAPPPAVHQGPAPSSSAIDQSLDAAVRDDLEGAAQQRSLGGYSEAAVALRQLAKRTNNLSERVLALTAAGASAAAAGASPLDLLHQAAAAAQYADTAHRGKLLAIVGLVRARWMARRDQNAAAYESLRKGLWLSADPGVRADAAPDVESIYHAVKKGAEAASLLQQWALHDSDPNRSAALQMVAADTAGNALGVMRAYSQQPSAVVAPGALGKAAAVALARAAAPSSGSHSEWSRMSQQILSAPGLSGAAAISLRLALADRLIALGDLSDADSVFAGVTGGYQVVPGDSRIRSLPAAQQAHTLFLAALSHWRTEQGKDAARTAWRQIASGNNIDPPPPSLWTPAPDERWYFETSALLSGQEMPSTYKQFLALEGPKRQNEGSNYLDGARFVTPNIALLQQREETGWMILGPYSNEGKKGFSMAYEPEKNVDLNKNYEVMNGISARWIPAAADPTGYVDLIPRFPHHDWVVAYAVTFIKSPSTRTVILSCGSDDGLKAWVNGALALKDDAYRGAKPGQDEAKVQLNQGWNEILLKITQGGNGWGYYCQIVDQNHRSIPDLVQASHPYDEHAQQLVRTWDVIGPYSNDNKVGFNTAYDPEKSVNLHATYTGKNSQKITWRLVAPTNGTGYVDLKQQFKTHDWTVAYAVIYVRSPLDETALLSAGSDDGLKAWVDGTLVVKDDTYRAAKPGQDEAPVQLRKGWNEVMLKVTQGGADWGFYCDLLNENHQPLENLVYGPKRGG